MAGRADFVLAPPTLSEKWALNPRLPTSQDSARAWGLGSQDYMEGKDGL